ncbi:hypothetical protein Csa_001837 [Cucumis sativus]|uniref:Uncharacterized protein n=1 Tax=Cucumis sativus TaxID=3659 RepID=A0A0A0LD55_CUCSA|nr:hypothetical protein Csa_001837 [Cucumis sativus]
MYLARTENGILIPRHQVVANHNRGLISSGSLDEGNTVYLSLSRRQQWVIVGEKTSRSERSKHGLLKR